MAASVSPEIKPLLSSPLEIVLGGLFLLITLLVVVIIYLRSVQQNFIQSQRKLNSGLGQAKDLLSQIQTQQEGYANHQKEPFLTTLIDIAYRIKLIETHLEEIEKVQFEIQNLLADEYKANQLSRWLSYINLVEKLERNKHVKQQILEVSQVNQELVTILSQFDELHEMPWSVALQARELMEYNQQAGQLLGDLQGLRLHGASFDDTRQDYSSLQQGIGNIPIFLITQTREEILSDFAGDVITSVNATVVESLPKISQIIRKADEWKREIIAIKAELDQAELSIAELKKTIDYSQDDLNKHDEESLTQELIYQFEQAKSQVEDPEIEILDTIRKDSSEISFRAREASNRLRRARRYSNALERNIKELHDKASEIKKVQEEIEHDQDFEIIWDKSKAPLFALIADIESITNQPKPYKLGEIEDLLNRVGHIDQELSDLETSSQFISSKYRELVTNLQSEQIKGARAYFGFVRDLWKQISIYNPGNWSKAEWVVALERDLGNIETLYSQTLPKQTPAPFYESTLEPYCSAMEQMLRRLNQFEDRVDFIHTRYRTIKNIEATSREKLSELRPAFAQITLQVLSNPLTKDKAEAEIVKLDREFDLCEEELRVREKDTVEKKLTRINQLAERVEKSGRQWLEEVTQDCRYKSDLLIEKIGFLAKIASFSDPIIEKCQNTLNLRFAALDYGDQEAQKMSLEHIIADLKRKNEYWIISSETLKELNEQVEQPVRELFKNAERFRQSALKQFSQAKSRIPEIRNWPPSSLVISVEEKELKTLEENWNSLRNEPQAAIQVVRILTELSSGYKALQEKLVQLEQWAIQEQNRITSLEAEIARLDHLWQTQEDNYSKSADVQNQIFEIRQNVFREVATLHQYWISGISQNLPSVDYDHILKRLIELSRNLTNARIEMANNGYERQYIDINGNIVSRRYP